VDIGPLNGEDKVGAAGLGVPRMHAFFGHGKLKEETGLTNPLLRSLYAESRQGLNNAAHSMKIRLLAAALLGLLAKNPAGAKTIPLVFEWVVGGFIGRGDVCR
jgi:hypothetical protein